MDYFKNTYQYEWRNTEQISSLQLNVNAEADTKISFITPQLFCRGCTAAGSGFSDLFEINVKTTVYRTETKRTQILEDGTFKVEELSNTKSVFKTFKSGPATIPNANTDLYYANSGSAYLRTIRTESKRKQNKKAGSFDNYFLNTGVLALVRAENHKTIEFTLPALTREEIEAGKGYKYTIECIAEPLTPNAMLSYYCATHDGWHSIVPAGVAIIEYYEWDIKLKEKVVVDPTSLLVTVSFYQKDMSVVSDGGPFITKGTKYSCYQLLRKALYTCDTQIIDNSTTSLDEYDNSGHPLHSVEFPIILDDHWNNRLQTCKINETIFECKNLWEVLIQIGYYLHAIPYLEFAEDGADRFVLSFKQLGDTTKKDDTSTKITVFNSRNLSEYFTQYDSYVTNLFSPQNVVEEWIVPKTSDASFLVSNNSSELQLAYGMIELLEFDISIKLDGKWQTRSALENVFEKSIYDILSNANPYSVYPSKGAALYYTLGDNKIKGFSFVPPSVSDGDMPMAFKRILQILWQGVNIGDTFNTTLKFNDLKFHVKYRTQDSARINQIRPDIQNFMKNSSLEKYPHHEQFYGQQDKIIDSERFSANLFGRLIRVGNAIFQRQEYADEGSEKESGDLVEINGEYYYVTAVENEYYADAVFQKVTYSKNFNQLSNIVTIPSEPRFYEVSERSKIRREVRLMDFWEISTTKPKTTQHTRFLNTWKDFIKRLIFNMQPVTLPNYAWTRFKVDKFRTHINSKGITTDNEKMFPSSLIDRTNPNAIAPKQASDHSDCIVPLLHFPLHDGIMFEWDMVDNFKAGDFVDEYVDPEYRPKSNDKAYLSMQPLRYVDIMGRADLFSFKLFNKTDWTFEQAQMLPCAVIDESDIDDIAGTQGGDNFGIALDKDCREEISFNYQINLLHRPTESDSEDFITFPNLFGEKESPLKMCFLSETQSMFNENINLSNADVLADDVEYSLIDDNVLNVVELRITPPSEVDINSIKAIVLYQINLLGGKYAYIVKNVSKLPNDKKLQSWWISPVLNS